MPPSSGGTADDPSEPAQPAQPAQPAETADLTPPSPAADGRPRAGRRPRRTEGGGQMAAEHAVLGLLALEAGAGHGYDLARHFGPGRPLAGVIRLEPGMLYHHLKKLGRAGWVSAATEAVPGRPARQVHSVTPAGQAELRRWLTEPVAHTREVRLEFLVKLYFARRATGAASLVARLVGEQRATLARLEGSLAGQLAALLPVGPTPAASDTDDEAQDDAAFARLVLELRLDQTRAVLGWLDRLIDERTADGGAAGAAVDVPPQEA